MRRCHKTVYILRHGQTDANAGGLIQGSSDFSRLTALGKEQAATVATQVLLRSTTRRMGSVYVSPLSRAQQTLQVIQDTLPADSQSSSILPGPATTLPNLREIDFYEWEGKHKDELERQYATSWKAWEEGDPRNLVVPDGNMQKFPLDELWTRAGRAWQQIQQLELNQESLTTTTTNDACLIVAHGSLGQALLGTAMGWDATHFRQHEFPNCGMVEIEWEDFTQQQRLATRWRWKWPDPSMEWSYYDKQK